MPSRISKAQAVRDYLNEHQDATPQAVVKALAGQGVKVGPRYVSQIKSRGSTHKASTKSKPKAQELTSKKKSITGDTSSAKGKPWTFPKNTLEEAIRIAKAIEEKNAGNPMHATVLAKAVGFTKSNDWRFLDLVRSANQYGLVSGAGATATVEMEKLGRDIVAPGSPQQRQLALLSAFNNVPDFKAVAEFYGGKKIPEDEFFLNTLTRQFSIPRDRVDRFAEVFVANLGFLRAFDVRGEASPVTGAAKSSASGDTGEPKTTQRTVSKEPRVREFLDTCFVMMPFGE
ncbi:hypothetical protein EPO44_14595, partial [bacterium]